MIDDPRDNASNASIDVIDELAPPVGREEELRRQLEAIYAVITAGLQDQRFDRVLQRVVREARERLGWGSLGVALRQDDGSLKVAAQYGFGEEVEERRFDPGRGIVGLVVRTGLPYLAPDTDVDPYYDPVVPGTRSEMCAPLRIGRAVRGVVNAESPTPRRFTPRDLDALVRLCDQVGLVLHNVELLEAERETVARLEELDQLKADFIAVTGHELRTPLTAVLGFAEMLNGFYDRLTDEQRRYALDTLVQQARLLAGLVEDVLVATRIERRQLSVELEPVAVWEVVSRVLARVDGRAEVGPGVDDAVVLADPDRLTRALRSLVDNAMAYGGDAPVHIDAERDEEGKVRIHVRDRGAGIPEQEQAHVFDRFHQIGQHGVTGRRGLGLGLSIARDLVRLMDGEVTLESEPGQGSTFTVTLRSASSDAPRPADRGERRSRVVPRRPRPGR